MSIRQGNKLLSAGQSLTQNLFDFKWADHILDDIQWLRADTFTWHDGRVYEAAYQHLLAEWNEVGDVPSTEIIAGTQIYYRLAPDGHKICSASQEDEAIAIYEATGIAWYYILDTTNQRFKLPRTKFGFVGLRDNDVGKYIQSEKVLLSSGSGVADYTEVNKATQMYLYFFVGNFAQSAVVNTAGINATLFDEIQGECIDLQNNKQDAATAVNYNNITNCITHIPQDIKFELNAGTLTLKAGSKVYVPNGVGVFDTITIASDLTVTDTGDRKVWVGVTATGLSLIKSINNTETGTPVVGTYKYYYDNTENKCYVSTANSYTQSSFPIAILTATSTDGIVSIDQIFNGFGYIGSTIYMLPGVKGLIPNGRNVDGSLKSIEFTLSSPITMLQTVSGWNGRWSVYTNGISLSYHPTELEYISDTKPIVSTPTAYWFCPKDNILYWTSDTGATWLISKALHVADLTESSMKIQSLNWKQPFKAVNYSDREYIAHQAMPSTLNINLTLGASGTSYTAPADGWFVVGKSSGTSGAFFNLVNETAGIGLTSDGYQTGNKLLFVPVSKGNVVKCSYNFSGSTSFFRFIYANGAK